MLTKATPTIFCFSDNTSSPIATGEAMMSIVSTPASDITAIRSSKCCIEYVIKRAFTSSLVPRMPSNLPSTSLPSSLKEIGKTCTTFLLFKFKFSSQSCRDLFMSKLVTSPSALEMITEPELNSPRRLMPPMEMNARFIFIPEDFSAIDTAVFTEIATERGSVTYPFFTPLVALSPAPITFGFFSPLKNSPTTTLVIEDPTSIPMEIFLIILVLKFWIIIMVIIPPNLKFSTGQVFFFQFLHLFAMLVAFQVKHAVDNQEFQPFFKSSVQFFLFFPYYGFA